MAITHGGVIKAAVLCALDAPLDAFWRIDVAPLSLTVLHAHDGRWSVGCVNSPLTADSANAHGALGHLARVSGPDGSDGCGPDPGVEIEDPRNRVGAVAGDKAAAALVA